ncbi:Universal stress protein [Novipirellula aureliae]|uniref:Universal stress protein n=1 Tax=Novipirellula aureliae TaxID=2527966 RepID=A0A5C6ECL1_9BACT|nr:universal stress protein [Novipirellula aureliae]TWU45286.1 Universal stress protein [Novipirellula aureliae]
MTNVVLAIDGSEQAEHAASFLCQLPLPKPVKVTLVSNVFIPSYEDETIDPLGRDFRQHQEEETKQFHDRATSILGDFADSIERKVVHGHIGHSIVKTGEDAHADIIVMGAKGHSQIARMLLGSTSDYVATHAKCNVIVVRGKSDSAATATPPTRPLNFTIALNETSASDAACAEIEKLDWNPDTSLNLLTVVPLFQSFSQDLMPNIVEYRAEQRTAAMRYLEKARDRFEKTSHHISLDIIESPHVGESIVNEVEQRESDMVVVGDSERSTITRMLLGSTSRFVLRHAQCTVWVARTNR